MKAEFKIEGDQELKAILAKIGKGLLESVEAATAKGAEVAVQAAKQRAPGPFIEAEVMKVEKGKAEIKIGPDKAHWYYIFTETGASRHEIDGHVRKALKFSYGGEEVILKSVRHPGMAASPFLRPALEENQERIKAVMGEEFVRRILALSS